MVRAATTGAFDFKQFDPFDSWSWRRLHWVLEEIDLQHRRQVLQTQHQQWVGLLVAASTHSEQSVISEAHRQSEAVLHKFLLAHYPWLRDKLGDDPIQREREELIQAYHDLYGYPGEPEYDKMVEDLMAFLTSDADGNLEPEL